MKRSTRLQPIAQIAERNKEKAAENLKACREELSRYEARLEQITAYRDEYLNKFNRPDKGMNAVQMKDFRVFIAKLDQAIEQMQDVIKQTEIKCNSGMTDWLDRRSRVNALDDVIARIKMDEERQSIRRDERESDERSQRQK